MALSAVRVPHPLRGLLLYLPALSAMPSCVWLLGLCGKTLQAADGGGVHAAAKSRRSPLERAGDIRGGMYPGGIGTHTTLSDGPLTRPTGIGDAPMQSLNFEKMTPHNMNAVRELPSCLADIRSVKKRLAQVARGRDDCGWSILFNAI